MFNAIEIDRNNLTIMGVKFSDLKTLESTANALGSNMFEGFEPTPKGIEIIRDYVTGKISLTELVTFAKQRCLTLNLNPPDNKTLYERYMKGTIESDVPTLTALIFELIETNEK